MLQPNQRKCPSCDQVLTYNSKSARVRACKKESVCRSCRPISAATRQKLSASLRGNKNGAGSKRPDFAKWLRENRSRSGSRGPRGPRGPLSKEHRLKISESLKDYYKTPEHRAKLAEAARRQWDAIPQDDQRREDYAWRMSVLEEHNHKCATCGETEGLHAHHILRKSKYPELRHEVSNGIALCPEHHAQAHEEAGEKDIADLIRRTLCKRREGLV